MKQVDVLIVGAGVAGSTAAVELSRKGLDVFMVDRACLPRHKVCGCCVNGQAVSMLDALGLSAMLRQAGARPIDTVTAACQGRSITLPSRGGVSISRYALDAILLDTAVRSGCEVSDQTTARVEAETDSGEFVRVCCTSERRQSVVYAKVVLVADGLAGSCMAGVEGAKRTTLADSLRGYGSHLPAGQHAHALGEVVMRCGIGGYVGTVVLEDGSLDIACAMRPSWVKACGGPAGAATNLSEDSGLGLEGLEALSWRATAPLTGGRSKRWMERVFFLGDAAGYVEPFTGEGIAWAMRSARTVVPFATQAAERWDAKIGDAWGHAYHSEVAGKQWRCKLFAAALRRPGFVSRCIVTADRLPNPLKRAAARIAMPPMFRPTCRPLPIECPAS